MASKKTRGARAGAKLGAKVAPKAGRAAGRVAWKAGKGEAKLIRRAMSAQQSKKSRYLKYAFFAARRPRRWGRHRTFEERRNVG